MHFAYHALVGCSTQGICRAVAEPGAIVTLLARYEAALREAAAPAHI